MLKNPVRICQVKSLSEHINGSNNPLKRTIGKATGKFVNRIKVKNVQAFRLITALILYGEGLRVDEVAKLLGVTFKTVINWILKFMSGGIKWAMGKHYHGRGRKEKLTKAQQKQVHDMIVEGPEAYGFSRSLSDFAL